MSMRGGRSRDAPGRAPDASAADVSAVLPYAETAGPSSSLPHARSERRRGVQVPAGFSSFPAPQGLYDARHEHDACGVAFVATLTGQPSHEIIDQALTALRNLEHRGASGSD